MSGDSSTPKPKVLVCQHGARHRYAIPHMLEEAGMLAALYTDSSHTSCLGRVATLLGPAAASSMGRLTDRVIRGIPTDKVFSSDRQYVRELFQKLAGRVPTGMKLYHQRHRMLSKRMISWGLKQADVVYSMYHENLDFIRWAKRQGAKSVVDVFINPETTAIMQREGKKFSDWVNCADREAVELENHLWQETAEIADLLLCPSEWVAAGVRKCSPAASAKIKVVPYGCSIDYQGRVNEPVPGRVLFAGGDALRKGLHYLGAAASILKDGIPGLDVRIAGGLPEKVVQNPVCKDLHFLGKLISEQMKEEYLAADVFVLPSLAEGFAGVVAEAIGAGCPVIVTEETGSPIVNEREGLIIPAGDAQVLAQAVSRMVTDREFRDRCSGACLEQVPFYTESAWTARLCAALQDIA